VIDGTVIDFVVDTGVADIVLTSEDARRMGIDPSTLAFDQEIKTAGGVEKAAAVRLGRLQVGSILIEDVPAKVAAGNAPGNVLGSAFFDRLSAWEIRNGTLMIVQ
jgi:aspartyl protease family protein